MSEQSFQFGYIAIVGRPNVGKSTLLNRLIGQRISIATRKPQTTRHKIIGIKTTDDYQVVYVDTPGIDSRHKRAMNRYMNKAASAVVSDVDAIIFMVEAGLWKSEDEHVLQIVNQETVPVFLALNKVDQVGDKEKLLPILKAATERMEFAEIIPLSAKHGTNLTDLENAIQKVLPEGAALFPEDQVTDRSERFIVSEIIREHLIRNLGDELPYRVGVEIERYKEEEPIFQINAAIWVERGSQKAIVIGKKGAHLKKIGTDARMQIQKFLDHRVRLDLWVRVREGWSDDERALRKLGYADE